MKIRRQLRSCFRQLTLTLGLVLIVSAHADQVVALSTAPGTGESNWCALTQALNAGGTLTVLPGTYDVTIPNSATDPWPSLKIYDGTILQGDSTGTSILRFSNVVPAPVSDWFIMFEVVGNNIQIRNLKISSALWSASPGTAISLGSQVQNFTMDTVTIDGGGLSRINSYINGLPVEQCHGIFVADGNDNSLRSHIVINNCTFTNCGYGIYSNNSFKGAATDWRISNCNFSFNYGDNIEINAPPHRRLDDGTTLNPGTTLGAGMTLSNGTKLNDTNGDGSYSDVIIEHCHFSTNLKPANDESAGFGIGLSGSVSNVLITSNDFTNYTHEAIHLENGCSDTVITQNMITGCQRGMRIGAANKNTKNISVTRNTLIAPIGPSIVTSVGIQLVDAGYHQEPLTVASTTNSTVAHIGIIIPDCYPVGILVKE